MTKFFSLSSQSAGGKPVFEAKQVKNSGSAGDIFMLPAGAGKISVISITLSGVKRKRRLLRKKLY